jgi:glyoxylase-like metal-dependent hydrolase (beta-lactamase superfamily II)
MGLRERYPDARVVVAEGVREFVTHPKALDVMVKEDHFISGKLASIGFNPGRPSIKAFSFPEECIVVKDRYDIDLGGVVLHCKTVQGHSPGNIAIHIPTTGVLAPSDSMGFHYPGRGFLAFRKP